MGGTRSRACSAASFARSVFRPGVVLTFGLAAWCAVILAVPYTDLSMDELPSIGRYLAAELFVTAAVACLARWRMDRQPELLRSAVALGIIGMALPALSVVVPWISDGVNVNPTAAVSRVAVLVMVFLLLTPRRAPGTATRRPSGRVALAVVAGPMIGVALMADALDGGLASPAAQRTIACAVEMTAALAWVLLGVHRRRRSSCDASRWTGNAMWFMAGSEYARAIGIAGLLPPTGIDVGLQLAAAGTVAVATFAQLRSTYRVDGARTAVLTGELVDTRRLLEQIEQDQRERLHDARSAVVGVIGASQLLAATAASPTLDRGTLQLLIAAELTRLQTVLDTGSVEQTSTFEMTKVLTPVLLVHQLDGATIRAALSEAWAHGRPRATATVLDNLVRNVRNHAPGATIHVAVERCGARVRLVVEDDGPGIPTAERAGVLLPGVRGASAQGPGSGLGLANSARAVADQGGDLTLSESPLGGLRVVVNLPVAVEAAQLIAG